jgi:hypothetical protein
MSLFAVIRDNYLPAVGVAPFLVTALLSHFHEAVATQEADDIPRIANRKALAH